MILDHPRKKNIMQEELVNLSHMEGNLNYISPEQTGRMNRSVDYRTDLYSLGATFYELLTGHPPFESIDLLEFIHNLLSKEPQPPYVSNTAIFPIISKVIMKLLAKNAEDRYQSAEGLKKDLCQIQQAFQRGLSSELDFELAQHDATGRLQIPQKLYGRAPEIRRITEIWEQVLNGNTEMVLIAGYSGVGKTSLVREVQKLGIYVNAWFLEGKFDQYQRTVPYYAFSQALAQLIDMLLAQSDDRLHLWKDDILNAIGQSGAVLSDIIPNLELLIGKQPAVPALGTQETINRMTIVFQSFIRVFSRSQHPLVLFVDDWQWADSASLQLLKALMNDTEMSHLFLIDAYRDNEVYAAHPFIITLNDLKNFHRLSIHSIFLKNLTMENIHELLTDTLSTETASLEALIYEKTQGNPFFILYLLNSLYEEGDIMFDFEHYQWRWSLEHIRQKGISDNVVDLLLQQIQRFPRAIRQTLQVAACIGNNFDIQTLRLILGCSFEDLREHLQRGLDERLLIAKGTFDNLHLYEVSKDTLWLQFVHDRIHQAAYALNEGHDRLEIHLTIARLLADLPDAEVPDSRIFEVVHHYNQSLNLLNSEEEQIRVIQFNLTAFEKAKNSSAYQLALQLIKTVQTILPPQCWQQHYSLAQRVYTALHEALFLNNDYDQADQIFEILKQRLHTTLERVPS
ncbi:MAG: AAA family ATPase [Nitrospirae bacterium]|nr:AAA family ATPase [Nitrospirota bacterium]